MATTNRNSRGGIDKPSTRGTQPTPRVTARYTPIKGANAGQRVSLMSDGSKQIVPALAQTGVRTSVGFETPSQTMGRAQTMLNPVSSDSVLNQRSQQDAMNMAANALVTSPSDGFQFTPLQQQYSQMMQQQQNQNLDMFGELRRGVDLMYDAQLARTNMQYNNLMNDLRADYQKQTDIASANAAALNPYSQAQGAMTANNFQGAISNEYQKQAARLQEAATVAQNELAAGNAQAYIEITNAMKQSNQLFQKSMMEFMMNAQSDFTKNQQWERSFELQRKEYSEGAFMNFVNQFGQDPAFKTGLQQYQTTGVISEGLMPLIQRGMEAGLSPAETLSIAQYETIDQRKQRVAEEQFQQQMNLGWYNAQTSRISAETARTKAMQDALAQTQEISDTRAQRASTMLDYGMRAFDILKKGDSVATGWSATASLALPGKGTEADKLQGYYETILANISLSEMQRLKDESETGATGFGPMAVAELNTLRDSMGALSVENDVGTQQENLATILAAQQNLINIHAAATGQIQMSPALITKDDILAEFGTSTGGGSIYKSQSGNQYTLPN